MLKPNFLRREGCPNCQTETMERFWPLAAFKPFKDLDEKGRYGSILLLACRSCGSEYFAPGKDATSVYLLTGWEKTLFHKFYDEANQLSQESLDVLHKVGSPDLAGGYRDYPVAVRTQDDVVKAHCVIRLMKDLWPPALGVKAPFLVSSIREVFVSPEAMTLEQRTEAYKAPEAGMGYAPLWLEKGDQVYRTSYGRYFIPEKMGRPQDFVIPQRRCSDQAPWLGEVPYELFIGRLV
jgi:hypothetical protein